MLSQRRRRERFSPARARAVRMEAKLTLAEIASALDVTPSAVSLWEQGKRFPRPPVADRYAAVLNRLERDLRRG